MAPTPYYPKGLELEGYHEQVLGFEFILGTFFSVTGIVIAFAWLAANRLPSQERGLAVWLVVTGIIHIVVEGTFSLCDKFYQNSNPNMLLLELWKEYSKADSRYATRDAFTTTMETCTAFIIGPSCIVATYGLISKSSWRWVLIILLSSCQLYGDVLYFATFWFEGGTFSRPEPLYFWIYFIFMNSIWIVVPIWCISYSAQQCMRATVVEQVKVKEC
jgi:cholestenol Delta-isomerase